VRQSIKIPTKKLFFYFYFIKNLKQSELAKKYGVSEKTINVWRKELSIPKKGHRNVAHPRFNPPKQEIERLYSDLKSSIKVGKYYHVDASTILYCLKRYGIKVQPRITNLGTSWNKGFTKKTSEKVRLMSKKSAEKRIGLLVGDKNPAKRLEVRNKIGMALQKRWDEPKERQKILKSFKNRPEIWNKGKTGIFSEYQLKRMSLRQKGINYEQRYGKEKAEEIKQILSNQKKGKLNPMWNNPILERTTKKDTSIELKVRRELIRRDITCFITNKFLHGFVGDIVFPKHNLVIECDGCYWHGCKQCKVWKDKKINDTRVLGNIERARRKDDILRKEGWIVLRFWEHEIKQDVEKCVDKIELCLLRKKLNVEV